MSIRRRIRVFVLASTFASSVVLVPMAAHVVSAEAVQQTGPNGAQCNLKGMDGDFVDPSNSDTTNNSNITLSGLSGQPAMKVAGCDLTATLPPPATPTPTPSPTPVRTRTFIATGAVSRLP
jgi:hypothetical protein